MSERGNLPSYNDSKPKILLIHLSVLIMGHTTLFAKLLPFHAVTIIGIRSIIAIVFLALFNYSRKGIQFLRLKSRKDLFFFVLLGSLMTIHWITYFHSIQVSTIAVGMVSLFTYPVFTAILEPLFFRGSVRIGDFLVALYVLFGIAIMGFGKENFQSFGLRESGNLTGVFWGMISAFLYSLRNILAKKKLKEYSSSDLMFYQLLVCGIVCFPFWEFSEEIVSPRNLLLFFLLGIVFTAIAHTLFLKSLTSMPATIAGILSSISPIYGTCAGWLYLSEIPETTTILGGLIVMSGSILESWKLGRKKYLI